MARRVEGRRGEPPLGADLRAFFLGGERVCNGGDHHLIEFPFEKKEVSQLRLTSFLVKMCSKFFFLKNFQNIFTYIEAIKANKTRSRAHNAEFIIWNRVLPAPPLPLDNGDILLCHILIDQAKNMLYK